MTKTTRAAKGEGSFKQNSDGSYTHRKSCGYKADGNRKILTVTAQTKSACIREMKRKEAEWNAKKALRSVQKNDTVTDLCNKHLLYQISNAELKPKSIDRRESTINNQISKYTLGNLQVNGVTSMDVEQHIQLLIREEKISSSSIVKVLDVLNAAFSWGVIHGMLEENPVIPLKDKLVKKLKKLESKDSGDADVMVLSEEEEEAFIREAGRKDSEGNYVYPAGLYLLFLLFCGCRVGELLALYWKKVDLDNGIITIDANASMAKNRNKKNDEENNFIMIEGTTKNQKARTIELTKEAHEVLKQIYMNSKWKNPENLVAPTLTGKMNTTSNMEHRLKVIMKNAELGHIKGGCHLLRKTFATNRYEEGWRIEQIASYIGDLESTTRKYYVAIRRKMVRDGKVTNVVRIPTKLNGEAG